jgi:hypothetical protein
VIIGLDVKAWLKNPMPRKTATQFLLREYLGIVNKIAPEVAESLCKEVYLLSYRSVNFASCQTFSDCPEPLKSKLEVWSKKFHLMNDYFLESALFTMLCWQRTHAGSYHYAPPQTLQSKHLVWEVPDFPPFEFRYDYDVSSSKEQITKVFEARLDEWLEARDSHLKNFGWAKDELHKDELQMHLNWLAREYVKKQTQKEIADEFSEIKTVTDAAVGKANRATSKLLEIPRRKRKTSGKS